jgi:hypothetical protein
MALALAEIFKVGEAPILVTLSETMAILLCPEIISSQAFFPELVGWF